MERWWRSRSQLIVRLLSLVVLVQVVSFASLALHFLGSLVTLIVGGSGGGLGLSLGLPVNFSLDPTSYALHTGNGEGAWPPISLRSAQAYIFLSAEGTLWSVWLLSTLAGLAFNAFNLFVPVRIWRMADGVAEGQSFTGENVRTLKLVGGLLVAAYALEKLRWLLGRYTWTRVAASGSVIPPDLTFQYRSDYTEFLSDLLLANSSFLLAGVGVWLIAEVFAYGMKLQAERDPLAREQDLTI